MRERFHTNAGWIAAILAFAALIGSEFGCSTSRISETWRDPSFAGAPMTSMFIVAGKKSPVTRRLWEDDIVAALSAEGVTAVPSYQLFPDSIPNPDQVGAAVRDKKFEGVLIVKKLATQTTATSAPGGRNVVEDSRYDPHSQTYSSFYQSEMSSAPADSNVIVRNEVSVFATDKEGGHLVWAGTGEVINPLSAVDFRNDITKLIAPELAKDGIIPNK